MENLHIKTPLVESLPLAANLNGQVWLKLEALQPSGSFKLRGIGSACQHYISRGAKQFISSSGGNAGIAVAYSGRKLGVPVTVIVPESTTKRAIEAIRQQEAEVIVRGESWQESNDYALQLTGGESVLVHPFDDPLLWDGHASIIDEIAGTGINFDAIVLSVGGGGLLCGIIEGLRRNHLNIPIIAVETEGADSLALSIKNGRLSALQSISSIATSLGAKQVADQAYNWSLDHEVTSHVVTDRDAVDSCLRFLQDHRLLVEPACGASLAALYNTPDFLMDRGNILVIVCGGATVTVGQLTQWSNTLMDS